MYLSPHKKGSIAFYALRMLQQDCVIGRGIEGLNPDVTDYNDERAINRWLEKHPKKKELSVEEQNILNEKMKKMR